MNTQELLEEVRTKIGVNTNYKLSKKLDISEARLSEYENGKAVPNNYAIAKFAKVLEVDPWSLVKEIEAQTEKNPKRREFWSKAAALFFFGVILNMTPTPSEANEINNQLIGHCILCQIVRQLQQRLLQAFKVRIPKSLLRFLIPRIYHMTT